MEIKRILQIDDDLGQQMLDLIGTINDEDMDVQAFIDLFIASLSEIGVFGAFDGDSLRAIVYFEPPTAIYPKRGYLYIAAAYPGTPVSVSRDVFDAGCDWIKEKGATYVWGWTSRNPRVVNRIYGFELVQEKQIILPLVGDDHLKVKRDKNHEF